jgi:hypothetical protein
LAPWLGVGAIRYHNHFTASFAYATNERQFWNFFDREAFTIGGFAGPDNLPGGLR